MKYFLYSITCLLSLIGRSEAQDLSQNVIASAGTDTAVGGYHISTLTGELSIQTHQNTFVLTEGFEQPEFLISTIVSKPVFPANLRLYPNPATEKILVRNENGPIHEISIINTKGRSVFHSLPDASLVPINITNLPSGAYYVVVQTGPQKDSTFRTTFVVLHD